MPVSTLPSGSGGDPLSVPVLSHRPVDLVLVLDRSGSMTPDRLPYMKQGARRLAERFCRAPDCRVGLVTYSGTARIEVPLTNHFELLCHSIDSIHAGGTTDHASALDCAHSLLDSTSFRRQAVLLFTDGDTTGRENPGRSAHALKADGVQVLTLGLGTCLPPLERWCSAPAEDCLAVTDRPADLPALMEALTAPLLGTPCDQPQPSDPPLPEQIPGLGCGSPRQWKPESSPTGRCFQVPACQSCTTVDLPADCLTSLGRMVYLNVPLKAICPNKRVAVAVQLTEVDRCGNEHPRGTRFFTIPPQGGTVCRDLELRCVRFIVPEETDSCGCGGLCRSRCFRARIMANYLDSSSGCCESDVVRV